MKLQVDSQERKKERERVRGDSKRIFLHVCLITFSPKMFDSFVNFELSWCSPKNVSLRIVSGKIEADAMAL